MSVRIVTVVNTTPFILSEKDDSQHIERLLLLKEWSSGQQQEEPLAAC